MVRVSGKLVEIQIRSSLQHSWAELSEKLSDVVDPAIKYGGGPDEVKKLLISASKSVATFEELETRIARLLLQDQTVVELRRELSDAGNEIANALNEAMSAVEKEKGRKP